jgi:hypothetical protein
MRKYEEHELGPKQSKSVVCKIGHARSGAKLHKGVIHYREVLDPMPGRPRCVITSEYVFCLNSQSGHPMPVHPIHPDWRTREFDASELTCKTCVEGHAAHVARQLATA